MPNILEELISQLRSGVLRVVDLTQPLSAQTPLLPLPPQWPNTPAFRLWEISRYDERGPAWYWNGFETGEHTGTHFDAPIHWVSGKDLPENSVDAIHPSKFIGPGCVIDVTGDVDANPDFLLTVGRVEQWESSHGRIPRGAWLLLRTGWSSRSDSARYINLGHDGPHVCMGQGSMEGEMATTWWIWWTGAGKHDIRPADTCPVLSDDQHPDVPGCLLPFGHAGRHMFRAGPA